jgi:hypothetical protein
MVAYVVDLPFAQHQTGQLALDLLQDCFRAALANAANCIGFDGLIEVIHQGELDSGEHTTDDVKLDTLNLWWRVCNQGAHHTVLYPIQHCVPI